MTDTVLVSATSGVATVTLNRPEIHNAFDDALIARLTEVFRDLSTADHVRAIVLTAAGKSFSSGADLGWMKRMAAYSDEDHQRDAVALALLMDTIDRCPKPTLALVQGAAFGSGVGLVAACDMAIASDKAVFCLPAVRLGLIPAVISPYVIAAMGARACRRYILSGERFSAAEARRLGLVHEVVAEDKLEGARDLMLHSVLQGGPTAQQAAKELIHVVAESQHGPELMRYTARRIADLRTSPEGKEGLAAFFERRKAEWVE